MRGSIVSRSGLAGKAKDCVARVMTSAARGLLTGAESIAPAESVTPPALRSTPIVPAAENDAVAEATSDWALMQLETMMASGMTRTAASMAAGYADAYARFALCHPKAFD